MDQLESCVPPGFRFHPTEEELVGYYLKRKINSLKIDLDVIVDIDLYKIEPWDIEEQCKLGYEEQNEWYFFSHKDKKYPTGTRTNRATAAGFWKATGRDKAILSKNKIIGMRKTLVFYRGRAPNGRKTDWIMHEYRLQTTEHGPPQDEGWVVCRAFKKPIPNQRLGYEAWNHAYYIKDGTYFRPPSFPPDNTNINTSNNNRNNPRQGFSFHQHQQTGLDQQDLIIMNNPSLLDNQLVDIPPLDSPSTISTSFVPTDVVNNNNIANGEYEVDNDIDGGSNFAGSSSSHYHNQCYDWKNLDDLLLSSSQLDIPAKFPQSNLMTINPNFLGLEAQTQSQFQGCFRDS